MTGNYLALGVAADQMVEASRSLVGDAKLSIVLAALPFIEPYEAVRIRGRIIAKHMAWLDYLTVTQRRWQRNTRNPNKARHHDSIAIRERYVRCHQSREEWAMGRNV